MVSRTEVLLSWLTLPIYAWQGKRVRKSTMRLSPPRGRQQLNREGSGTALKVLILGDSSAAGVGVDTVEESLAGHLLEILGDKTGRPIEVAVCGNNSATADQVRDWVVPNLDRVDYDYISLNIGVNDAKNFHRGNQFCKSFGGLIYALKSKFPNTTIIWGGIIDLSQIPALPWPLNRLMGIRGDIIRNNGQVLCRERGAHAPQSHWQVVRENFSVDGFHASSLGYQRWAEELAEYIIACEED